MTSIEPVFIHSGADIPDLADRILAGEVFVVRQGLQSAGVFDEMLKATQAGLSRSLGEAKARAIAEHGYDRIHEEIEPTAIPEATDAVYAEMIPRASAMLDKIVATLFPKAKRFFFEREPNVRFHIPIDRAHGHKKQFDAFAKKHGQGKIAPHGPHRDPWLDCPDNVVNIWIAVGPVTHGNGLTVFPKSYLHDLAFNSHGEIEKGQSLARPMTFDLAPGDIVLFHSDHLHGSEINRTNQTRYVVSYRVSFDRPHFPYGHYHSYLHAGLARGRLRVLADVPARLQISYVRSLFHRLRAKISGKTGLLAPERSPTAPAQVKAPASLKVSDIAIGQIVAYDERIVIARLTEDEFIATSRTCPHKGGDLADGFVHDGHIVCPWHNLPFDALSGRSSCQSLKPLLRFPVSIANGTVLVATDKPFPIVAAAE